MSATIHTNCHVRRSFVTVWLSNARFVGAIELGYGYPCEDVEVVAGEGPALLALRGRGRLGAASQNQSRHGRLEAVRHTRQSDDGVRVI